MNHIVYWWIFNVALFMLYWIGLNRSHIDSMCLAVATSYCVLFISQLFK